MTNKQSYNGWTNRETWLVNLHFEETVRNFIGDSSVNENNYEVAENLKDYMETIWEDDFDNLSSFLKDYIDLSLIDWNEIVENYEE